MRYMLVNVSGGNLQVDLHNPNKTHTQRSLNRMGPDVALRIPRGESVDILPHFGGSLEKAHTIIKYSRDVLRLLSPSQLCIYLCDDAGNQLDPDKLLGSKDAKEPVTAVVPPSSDTVAKVLADRKAQEPKVNAPPTFKRYTKEELNLLNKKNVIKVAESLNLRLLNLSTISKDEVIEIILGAQNG